MRLSGSYFKKLDYFAKWVFGKKDNNASVPQGSADNRQNEAKDPRTVPENEQKRGYISFRNESSAEIADPKQTDLSLSMSRKVLTERCSNPRGQQDVSLDSARYIKKTDRGNSSRNNKGQMSARQACTICLDSEANAVLMDCGHGAICFQCGIKLLGTTCECHLCRQPVVQVLKIDTSFVHDDLLKVLEAADLHNIIKYQHTGDGNSLHTAM